MSMQSSGRPPASFEEAVGHIAGNYKTVGELAYDTIKEAILSGRFAPGERLRQEALASAIGISRIPVRSALIQLESEGLVSYHSRRGAVVRSLTIEQVREIYELRELLETHALRRAVPVTTPQRLDLLRELADVLDAQQEGAEFVDARVAFYRELYDAERNPQLVKLIEELRGAVGRYLLGWRVSHGQHASHRELVEAVASGDAERAVTWLREHLTAVRDGVESIAAAAAPPVEHTRRRRAMGNAFTETSEPDGGESVDSADSTVGSASESAGSAP